MGPQAPWSPTAHAFAQHQFSHVANFWKQGRPASFQLEALPGGHAKLSLSFQLPLASEVVPPPSKVLPAPAPQRPIPPLFPEGCFPHVSGADSKIKHASKKVSSKQRKSYQRSVLHRASLAASSLPPPQNGSLRQAALASVQRQEAVSASPVTTIQIAKKRPLPVSPSALPPSNLPPLSQRIRKDIQIGESEAESPEKEVLRSPPCLENSPAPFSPCMKGIPSPAPLVFTPVPPERLKLNCSNCDAGMTPQHQCEALVSETEAEEQQLPLCLYCCHRGSDEHPVHFFVVCICSDDECTCFCYCDEEQFLLKQQLFPSGLGSKRAVGLEGRAQARATALASPWIDSKPCERADCCMKCNYDTPCSKLP